MKLSRESQPTLLELATYQRNLATDANLVTELPEQRELDELLRRRQEMRDAAASAQLAVDDMETEILRIQDDETKLRRRDKDARAQLGAETDPERRRDLEHDRYSAKSRLAALMAELQEAHNEIHALRNNRDAHGARVDELERKVEAAARARDAAREAAGNIPDPASHVEQLRAQIDAAALAEYERQREENGVGAASFNGRTCGGCFIVLPPSDRSAIQAAPADEVPQCTNCGSYLIRRAQ